MAIVTAFKSLNMNATFIWFGDVTIANASHIQIALGGKVANYYGSFIYDDYGLAGGTITAGNYSEFGSKMLELTNGHYSVLTYLDYVLRRDDYSYFSYLFSGNDTFNGSSGNDALYGFAGNDSMYGNSGNDTLAGGIGNDLLVGAGGKDSLTGNLGSDIFDFNAGNETGVTRLTRDIITDFKSSESDKIDLSTIDANAATTGVNDAFKFIGTAAFSGTNAVGQLRFGANTQVLYGSTDADAVAEFAIQVNGVSSLSAGNFVL